MLNLNTNLTKETIKKSDKLQEIFSQDCHICIGWGSLKRSKCWRCNGNGKLPKYKITIADVISNAKMLFGNYYFKNMAWLLIACDDNKPLEEIEKYVLSNLK